jgi:glycosyltransferase involved in cell wall biosynthesis
LKLSCCLIARDAGPELEKAIDSIRPLVDEIVLVWTSLDWREIPGVEKYIFTQCNADKDCPPDSACKCKKGDMLDFAAARTFSFEKATGDYLVWIDADDIVEVQDADGKPINDPDALRRLCTEQPRRYGFPYEYYYDHLGRCCSRYHLPRLMPKGSYWEQPIHEASCSPHLPQPWSDKLDHIVWKHQRDSLPGGSNRSNLRNARIGLHWKDNEKYKKDPRFLFYLGQSLQAVGDADGAIKAFIQSVICDKWGEQKYWSCEKLVEIFIGAGKYSDAFSWACRAVENKPELPNSFALAGKCLYHLSQHADQGWLKQTLARSSVAFFTMGFELPPVDTVLPIQRDAVSFEAHKYYNLMLSSVGRVRDALESCEAGLKIAPDGDMEKNALIYRAHLAREELLNRARELSAVFAKGSDVADNYVRDTPGLLTGILPAPVARDERLRAMTRGGPVKKIAMVCGIQWLEWGPVKGAPGGSEIAIIELSKRFAARGYHVTVFTEPLLDPPDTYDGVKWAGTGYCETNEEFDLCIAWRGLDRLEGANAKRKVLWMHDMDIQHVTPSRLAAIDIVAVNSQWHADVVRPQLPGRHVEVLGAGFDTRRLAREKWHAGRQRRWCVWSSSFDRGLDFMVDIWPTVRERGQTDTLIVDFPELHVLYGFDGSLNMARKNKDVAAVERIESLIAKCKATPGVVLHGRLPDAEYDALLMQSGVWAYPKMPEGNSFGETFGVSACEAICAGLRVVVSPYAALAEVASPYAFRQVYGKREDPSYREAFIGAIVDAMTDPEDGQRELLADAASARFDWDRVADRWEERVLKS